MPYYFLKDWNLTAWNDTVFTSFWLYSLCGGRNFSQKLLVWQRVCQFQRSWSELINEIPVNVFDVIPSQRQLFIEWVLSEVYETSHPKRLIPLCWCVANCYSPPVIIFFRFLCIWFSFPFISVFPCSHSNFCFASLLGCSDLQVSPYPLLSRDKHITISRSSGNQVCN